MPPHEGKRFPMNKNNGTESILAGEKSKLSELKEVKKPRSLVPLLINTSLFIIESPEAILPSNSEQLPQILAHGET